MEDAELDDELEKLVTGAPASSVAANSQPEIGAAPGEWFVERAKYIPVRLTLGERKMLRLLDAALQVSEYTDKIDTIGYGMSKAKRIVHQIRELCSILSGLMLAADYKKGQELFEDRDFVANESFFQRLFEIGRRHKIQNPDKMRTTCVCQVSGYERCVADMSAGTGSSCTYYRSAGHASAGDSR